MITTTINKLRACEPCEEGWRRLLRWMRDNHPETGPDQEFPMVWILDSNGLDDCLWALRSRPDLDPQWRLLACDFADRVRHQMTDPRSVNALDTARRFANGLCPKEELETAYTAARAAARIADAGAYTTARAVACATAYTAAYTAGWATYAAARAAARAAGAAAWAAAYTTAGCAAAWAAADAAACAAACAAADAASCDTERGWQTEHLRTLLAQ